MRELHGMTPAQVRRRLEAIGARFTAAVLPTQVVVWAPRYVENYDEYLESGDLFDPDWAFGGSCLADTQPGERALVYEKGAEGNGLVGVFDFNDRPMPNERWGRLAPGLFTPLDPIVPRALLVAADAPTAVRKFFANMQGGKRRLPETTAREILGLTGDLPDFAWRPVPPDLDPDDFNSVPGTDEVPWANEREMQRAVGEHRPAWNRLGCSEPPLFERRSNDRFSRYDLISYDDEVVIETKLAGDLLTLEQIRRYLSTLRKERGGEWQGHIVVGMWATGRLQRAVQGLPDVRLWHCHRRGSAPHLEELT